MDSGSTSGQTTNAQQRTWAGLGSGVLAGLHRGWMCFDSWAGWLIGLDNSKYQWAVAQYELEKREEELEGDRRVNSENAARAHMEEGAGIDSGVPTARPQSSTIAR
ncbi:hypothetical protein HYH03_009927 [Edaphochlamys debaryana]|uniref:Uncharacterized protein n=1 Tax=Edaphochlamys debaryana TaxID=47281 RepID=A0A835Y0D5_9CHLO|nr:hypothetical protein HYH03_009927 [Edaphochlamys debaryana]|eukprot:KAG2491766.1 hypothetical protein HYH03_009927 [Edaphochlamys debaryana]